MPAEFRRIAVNRSEIDQAWIDHNIGPDDPNAAWLGDTLVIEDDEYWEPQEVLLNVIFLLTLGFDYWHVGLTTQTIERFQEDSPESFELTAYARALLVELGFSA